MGEEVLYVEVCAHADVSAIVKLHRTNIPSLDKSPGQDQGGMGELRVWKAQAMGRRHRMFSIANSGGAQQVEAQ